VIMDRRSLLSTAGLITAGSAFWIAGPSIVRAATPVKLTLPWLPLGTFSYTFVAKRLGFWEKRGLDVTIDSACRVPATSTRLESESESPR